MPRPRGRSPIAACVSSSSPVVMNRSSDLTAGVDDAEGRVPRAGEARRRLDEALEERVERELRAECDACFDELLEPVAVAHHERTVIAGNPHRESSGFTDCGDASGGFRVAATPKEVA